MSIIPYTKDLSPPTTDFLFVQEYSKSIGNHAIEKGYVMSLREIKAINLDACSLAELQLLAAVEAKHLMRHKNRKKELFTS